MQEKGKDRGKYFIDTGKGELIISGRVSLELQKGTK